MMAAIQPAVQAQFPYVFDLTATVNYRKQCGSATAFASLQNNDFYKFLACCDFCHDFDDKAGRVDDSTWGDGTNAVGARFAYLIKTALNSTFNITTWSIAGEDPSNPAKTWLSTLKPPLPLNPSISPSAVENQTIQYFEEHFNYELKVEKTEVIKYQDIVDKINEIKTLGVTDNNQIIYLAGYGGGLANGTAITGLYGDYQKTCILDVDLDGDKDWDRDYSTQDKINFALFFLNYFFKPPSSEFDYNSKYLSYITFDADSNIPSKIFGLLDQVINLVTPLNISDSATGESHLVSKQNKRYSSKNCYKFPTNDTNGYLYSGNQFTGNIGNLRIDNLPNYGETNRYDFSINLLNCANNSVISSIKFDSDHKSGPSVNYLANLANDNLFAYPGKKMADLTYFLNSIITNYPSVTGETISQLLFDIKRCGDWEQCNAAFFLNNSPSTNDAALSKRVILCSLDRLCALYSRCIGNKTIWHHGTHLKLYRFPENLTAEDQATFAQAAAEAKHNKLINKLKALSDIYSLFLNYNFKDLNLNFDKIVLTGIKIPKTSSVHYNICLNLAKFIIITIYLNLTDVCYRLKLISSYFQADGTLTDAGNQERTRFQTPELFDKYANSYIDLIFATLSTLCGDVINEKTGLIFKNHFEKFVEIFKSENVKVPKITVFQYNGGDICNLFDILTDIAIFDSAKVRTQSIFIKDYFKSLIERNLFAMLESIKSVISKPEYIYEKNQTGIVGSDIPLIVLYSGNFGNTVKNTSILIDAIINCEYPAIGEDVLGDERKTANSTYYNGMKSKLEDFSAELASQTTRYDLFFNSEFQTIKGYAQIVLTGGKPPTKTNIKDYLGNRKEIREKIREESKNEILLSNRYKREKNNILSSLESELTDRFMEMSSEIYRHNLTNSPDYAKNMLTIMGEFERFCDNSIQAFRNTVRIMYDIGVEPNDESRFVNARKSYTCTVLFFYYCFSIYVRSSDANSVSTVVAETQSLTTIEGQFNVITNQFFSNEDSRFFLGEGLPTLKYDNANDVDQKLIIMHICTLFTNQYSQRNTNISKIIFDAFYGVESLFRLVLYEWKQNGPIRGLNDNDYGYTDITSNNVYDSFKTQRLFIRSFDRTKMDYEHSASVYIFNNICSLLHKLMLLGIDQEKFNIQMGELYRIQLFGGNSNKTRTSRKFKKIITRSKKATNQKMRVTQIHRNNKIRKTIKKRNKLNNSLRDAKSKA